ncbi:putative major facilitator superfamily permease [Ordospora colligata]|uniref:Putative major facilitator superfamily permease n=1 Tax=Ordospora colligata OC4 TaxID=1354746 RepID=A0A0B2UHY2_9MICR|nr:putative major facilitator superfamily permease [Ordospora colligata OC4]KHN68953.1 putative major facilitator superfamily permease [Ordospora colligata OC4]TBU13987.1 putative major facilitator superfamily permease [Ordospora colligata]TBU14176.1 putative major facilitator superfamily permease [Ordospora colligata]TBU17845.1 putative major facilitator superfamily permease [Ordospora colligata]
MNFLPKLNRKCMLIPKILYFSASMQHYMLHKFRYLFAKEKFGIAENKIWYVGIIFFIAFFMNILFATINDKFRKPKIFMACMVPLSGIFFQLFYIDAYIRTAYMFWINLFMYITVNAAIPVILDKVMLDYLNKFPDMTSKMYGRQRIWATIGYMASTFTVEGILRKNKEGVGIDFSGLPYYSAAITLINFLLVVAFIENPKNSIDPSKVNIMSEWKELIRNKEYLFFILIILMNGITRSGMTIYLPVYITEVLNVKSYILPESWEIHALPSDWTSYFHISTWILLVKKTINIFNRFPLSTIAVFEILLEMVSLFYSQTVIRSIGLIWPLLLAQASQAIRFILYLVLPHSHPHVFIFCCVFEIFKGINFGLTHGSGVQLAENLCSPHLKATSQAIYHGVFGAVGSVSAGLLFRQVFRHSKPNGIERVSNEQIQSFRTFFMLNTAIACVSIILVALRYGSGRKRLYSKLI